MNIIDRAVSFFNPVAGARRQAARLAIQAQSHVGASYARKSLQAYRASEGNSDYDDIPDLPVLRERSRDLYRNNNHGRGAIKTNLENVVGPGLRLRPSIDNEYLELTPAESKAWEENTEREFRLFSETKSCDRRRMLNFYELQQLVFLSVMQSGDSIALLPLKERKDTPYKLTIQILEGDQLCNPFYGMDTQKIAGGVEVDEGGEPVFYHIRKRHPGALWDVGGKWIKVRPYGPASGRRNLIHLLNVERPGQRRGLPFLSPVIESLKQIGRYTEAELMAAVVAGMFTVYVTSENNERLQLSGQGSQAEQYEGDIALGNGAAVELSPGQKIQEANPMRPNSNFSQFVDALLMQVGSALGIPYELLRMHFSASYSASRAALQEAWKFFRSRREWLARNFCQPVYDEFLYEAVLNGRISAPGFLDDPAVRKAYSGADWTGQGTGQINPVQETKAAIMRINSGLSTRTQEAYMINGSSYERNAKQIRKENELSNSLGINTNSEETEKIDTDLTSQQ